MQGMETAKPTFWGFIRVISGDWMARMSGPASVPLTILAIYLEGPWVKAGLIILAFICAWIAAYRVWAAERERVRVLEDRLSPKIDVYLDRDGVRTVETRIGLPPSEPQRRGPDSKWVQIIVMPATDAQLVDCEVRLLRAERINDDRTATVILTEPVFCTWSNMPAGTTRMTIPSNVPQASNIFSANDGSTELYMQTSPIKCEFRDQIQRPGTYRLKIGVSAQDCLTNVKTFLFRWSSYNSISISMNEG